MAARPVEIAERDCWQKARPDWQTLPGGAAVRVKAHFRASPGRSRALRPCSTGSSASPGRKSSEADGRIQQPPDAVFNSPLSAPLLFEELLSNLVYGAQAAFLFD